MSRSSAAKKPVKSGTSKSAASKKLKPSAVKKSAPAAAKKPLPKGKVTAKKPAPAKKPTKPANKPQPAKASREVPAKAASKSAVAAKKAAPAAAKPEPRTAESHSGSRVPGRFPPQPSRPLSPPSLVPPPPPVIPVPPRPPGPPLLRKIQHLQEKTPDKLTLVLGDKAVHPRHGVGEVIAIEVREIGGAKGEFYVIRLLDDPTKKIMVPVNATLNAGLRPVMSEKEADNVMATMRADEVAVNEHPWSRRFRAYTEMINSGSPFEVAKVMRDMYRLKFDKDLSFGERRLLDQARSLLMKELALAKKIPEEELQAEVSKMFEAN